MDPTGKQNMTSILEELDWLDARNGWMRCRAEMHVWDGQMDGIAGFDEGKDLLVDGWDARAE